MANVLIQETPFKTISVKPLHPTFGASVSGVNFERTSDEQLREIIAAMAQVLPSLPSSPLLLARC